MAESSEENFDRLTEQYARLHEQYVETNEQCQRILRGIRFYDSFTAPEEPEEPEEPDYSNEDALFDEYFKIVSEYNDTVAEYYSCLSVLGKL